MKDFVVEPECVDERLLLMDENRRFVSNEPLQALMLYIMAFRTIRAANHLEIRLTDDGDSCTHTVTRERDKKPDIVRHYVVIIDGVV